MKQHYFPIAIALFVATPAWASHPPQSVYAPIDMAAQPAYVPDFAPVGHVFRHVHRHRAAHREVPARIRPEYRPAAPKPLGAVLEAAVRAFLVNPEGCQYGSPACPKIVTHRPRLLEGALTIGNSHYQFASGGNGWSIPLGTVRITPETVGSWGSRHGAIGLAEDTIYDPQLGRDREGIELHPASHMASAGCVVIDRSRWTEFKRKVMAMIEDAGQAFLHIGLNGAAITPTRASPLPPIIYIATKEREDEPRHRRVRYAHHHRRVHLAGA